ncbi:B12-binding domain-containing radical SAM protein [Mycobacterium conspicuum]|nr:radical SAM protein [Mycobacterium conspicuum]ORV44027.1 radical SAM protein [Mycobacterium conspicuum]
MADIVLVNPRFDVSYWGLEHALPLLGKRRILPSVCLPLLAALTPDGHCVTIVDENVERIDYERLAKADIVGLTGMDVQGHRMLEILRELKARNVFTVVGGPSVTVQEEYFAGLADVIFVGEADTTWPQFLDEWAQGRHARRYEQTEPTDMTRSPVPRYDLVKAKHYLFGSVQFSRGCPFQCEFCDIPITFGRRPRLKTSAQVITELEAMRKQRVRIAFIVDDNLIGTRIPMKKLLQDVAAWQAAKGYPMAFVAYASLNLAEDDEMMELLDAANVAMVFIGIESPSEESLRETKKYQNVRKGGTIVDRVRKVQDAGLEVLCGMIVGFDHDDERIFKAQYEFIRQTDIMHPTVNMLVAIPKTPLYARLKNEGRLDLSETNPSDGMFGTNVIPLGMTRDQMRDGYIRLMLDLHDPEFYFDRLENLYLRRRIDFARARNAYWCRHPWIKRKSQSVYALGAIVLFLRLMSNVPDPRLRRIYRRRMTTMLRHRPDPTVLFICAVKCAMHYHQHVMSREIADSVACPTRTRGDLALY